MNEQLISAAGAVLERAGVAHSKATVLVALSGGADSVALLFTVLALQKEAGFTVRAAHVEHGLRGEESLADAEFCRALCERYQVPFTCDHAALAGGMHAAGVEAAARAARYTLLLHRAKACGADALLLAHHQDDQAETVLQHLLRGSGARGLSGMEAITRRDGVLLCRPFLTLPKQALVDALADTPYRTDGSNRLPVCQRNRLRLYILPRLAEENPAAAAHIAQSARLLQLDEACLSAQAERLLTNVLCSTPPYFCLLKQPLQSADAAVALRTLRRFAELGMRACGNAPDELSLSAEDSLALLELLNAPENTVINLPGALHASVTERFLHLTRMRGDAPLRDAPPPAPLPLPENPGTLPFGGITLSAAPYAPGGPRPDGRTAVALARALASAAVLRLPQPGDTIRPFGTAGQKPLRRYLTDKKLDPPFRPALPVIAVGCQVLWAVGIGAAESTRLTDAPSMLFTLQGTLPWLHQAK